MKSFASMVMVCFFVMPAIGQLNIKAELRQRAELRNGYRTLPSEKSDPAFFISQRTRLAFTYGAEKYSTGLMLQDVRVWGDEAQLADAPSTAIHEAWLQLKFNDKWNLKTGRQEIIIDDHRLMGNVDWVQQARSHDAAILSYQKEKTNLKFAGAFNQAGESNFNTLYTPANNYKALLFAYGSFPLNDKIQLALLSVNDGFQKNDSVQAMNFRLTNGVLLNFKTDKTSAELTGYFQGGKTPSGSDIEAYMIAGALHRQFGKFKAGVVIDYLSGTDFSDSTNKKLRTFHTLYATNHKFYGHMDYFLNIPADTRNGGLVNPSLRTKYKFTDKTECGLDVHYFMLAQAVQSFTNPLQSTDKNLGAEIDLMWSYQCTDMVNVKAGASVMMPEKTMTEIKGGDANATPVWFWVMLTAKPTLWPSN